MALPSFLRRNFLGLAACALLGLAAGRALYNHAGAWQLPAAARLGLTLATVALTAAFAYLVAYRSGWRRLPASQRLAWLLLSLGGGALLLFGGSITVPIPEKHHALEITVTGLKNPASRGSQVRLLEISLPNGEKVYLDDTQKEGGWHTTDGALAASGQPPAALRYYFKGGDGGEMHILFDAQPDGGQVSLRLDDFSRSVDLFEAEPAITQVDLPIPYNMPLLLMLYAADILALALLVFSAAVLYRAWLQRTPRLALAALLLAGALALALPGLHTLGEPAGEAHTRLWWLVSLFELSVLLVLRAHRQHLPLAPQRLVYLLALAACFAGMTDWGVFYVSADSNSYTAGYFEQAIPTRPPLYPLFIQAVTSGTGYDHTTTSLPRGEPLRDAAHPLLRVAVAQQALLFAAALTACLALMLMVDAPLAATLFLWLYDFGFFSIYTRFILSEPLTLALMFLLVAAFLTYLVKRWRVLLPLAAVCCGLLYITRPAGVFGVVILAAMFLAALYFDPQSFLGRGMARRPAWARFLSGPLQDNLPDSPVKDGATLRSLLLSTALLLLLVSAPVVELYFRTGRVTISPMYYITRVAFALQVAQPQDVDLMPDEQTRQFFLLAMQRKQVVDAQIRAEYPDEYLQHCWYILRNPYDIAIPVASEMIGDWYGAFPVKQDLMLRAAQPILARRWQAYLGVAWKSFILATTRGTQFNAKDFGFWPLMLVCLGLMLIVRGRIAYAAAGLILAHLAHLVVICLGDSPSGRYVQAAEFMVVIAVALLVWALLDAFLRQTRPPAP